MTGDEIFSRLTEALKRAAIRPDTPPRYLFLGVREWEQLGEMCAAWDVEWKGGDENYDPITIADGRAEFRSVKIYRVDAAEFLEAL